MLPNSETFEILIKQLILEGDVQSIVALLVRRCRCRCCLEVVRGTREVEVTCVFFFRILLLRGCMVVFSLLPGTRHAQVWFYGTQQYNEPVVGGVVANRLGRPRSERHAYGSDDVFLQQCMQLPFTVVQERHCRHATTREICSDHV